MPNEGYSVRFKKSAAKELQGLDLDLQLRLITRDITPILKEIKDHEKPFASPYYWAAFCAIGKI